MTNADFVLHSVPRLLEANKSKTYHCQVLNLSTVLMRFYRDHGLLTGADPFDSNGEIKRDFVLMKSNVTEEGLELFKKAVQGWLRFVDKGGNTENISRLEKGLAQLRENK